MAKDQPGYQDRIIQDPEIMAGKPVVKGARIPGALVLGHLAHNPDLEDLFEAYPHLTIEDVKACLAYAQALAERKRKQAGRRSAGAASAHL